MVYQVHTLKQRPDLTKQVEQLNDDAWPEFMHHGDAYHWHTLFSTFADFQILFCNPPNTVVASGFTVPLIWNNTLEHLPSTIEDIFLRALDVVENQQTAKTLVAVAAIVSKSNQGQGLSSKILREMKSLARKHELSAVIVPVRPIWKARYPLTPMERYTQWARPDGAPFDPWLRVHWRLGAEQLQVAPSTLTVSGTVSEWEAWTNMEFPDSGPYIVSGALQPVTIDRERDEGFYEDPRIWMKHPVQIEEQR
ncbi:MAG: hypothetical protein QGD96_07770 [Anaerolineae bacterium]|nr:hypothetical protein [Anaerolineae bacterium]